MLEGRTPDVFVGRQLELGELRAVLDRVDRGGAILIAGEPGIGKTRLVSELADAAQARGDLVAWGRCWEAGGAPAYWPWIQVLRFCLEHDDDGGPGETSERDFSSILRALESPDMGAPHAGDPEAARFRLFDSVARTLADLARRRRILILLEDLHAADLPSLLLFRLVVGAAAASNMVVVGTYRDVALERGHPSRQLLSDLAREPDLHVLRLGGLAPDAVSRLVEQLTSRRIAPPVAALIHRETEGNPLFVVELVRLLASHGSDPVWDDLAGLRRMLPDGVKDAVGRRLETVDPDARRMLASAAVLGRDFDVDVLAGAAGTRVADVLVLLEGPLQSGIVEETTAKGRMRFTHSMLRDVAYEELAASDRAILHARVAETLEERGQDEAGSSLDAIAFHHLRSLPTGDAGRAVTYAARAADQALRRTAYEEAARLYGMALTAAEHAPADPVRTCDLLLALGDALARAGDVAAAKAAFLHAAAIAAEWSEPERRAHAALGYGGRFVWEAGRGDPHLRRLLGEALDALPAGDDELRARILARLAGGPMREDTDRDPRDELSAEAVAIARRLGDQGTLAYCLDGRYSSVWGPDKVDDRIEIASELIDVARAAGDLERSLQGHHYRCLARLELADARGFQADLDAQAAIVEELRQPVHRWYVVMIRAMAATLRGALEEAEALLVECRELGLAAHGPIMHGYRTIQLYALRREQHRLPELIGELAEAISMFPTYAVLRCIHAQALAEIGRADAAAAALDGFRGSGAPDLPRNEEWLFAACCLAETAAALGDEARIRLLRTMLEPFADRVAVSPVNACSGAVARILGLLAAAGGEIEEAERHFVVALEVNRSLGAQPWVARTQLDWGATLFDADGARADRAEELVLAGLGAATTPSLRERGVVLLARLGSSVPRIARTFLFTDIVGSTALIEAIGDEAWGHLRRWHDEELRARFAAQAGEEVDHAGDGFFVAFASAEQALSCAVEIQRSLDRHRRSTGFAPGVRIGVHTAEAAPSADGYSGLGVHTAARIGALAGGGEILASVETLDAAGNIARKDERSVTVKGVGDPVRVATVSWAEDRPSSADPSQA